MLFHLSNQKYYQRSENKKKIFSLLFFRFLCVHCAFAFVMCMIFFWFTCLNLALSRTLHRNPVQIIFKHFFCCKTIFPFWLNWQINIQNTLCHCVHTMLPFLKTRSAHFYSIIRLNNLYGQCHLSVRCSLWFSCFYLVSIYCSNLFLVFTGILLSSNSPPVSTPLEPCRVAPYVNLPSIRASSIPTTSTSHQYSSGAAVAAAFSAFDPALLSVAHQVS